VTSARDEIWIDMVQFDVRAADRLWEGIPPAQGAPEWYDDVSGLIETASGPAEPCELVDEPVVVEDMHKTTLGRPRHCRHGRTLGGAVAMKAAAATTAGVLGVAAAAAATTGIVATMASVVVPAIEEHVLMADDDDQEAAVPAAPDGRDSGGTPDTRPKHQPNDVVAAPPAAPATPDGPQPADPESTVASAFPDPAAAVAETSGEAPPADEPAPPAAPLDPGPADAPPPAEPAALVVDPPTDSPGGSGLIESASAGPEPGKRRRVVEPPATEPALAIEPPSADVGSDEDRRGSDKGADAGMCARHACSGRGHYQGGGKSGHREARANAVELVERAGPDHARRPG
jgi:hypothetical protein